MTIHKFPCLKKPLSEKIMKEWLDSIQSAFAGILEFVRISGKRIDRLEEEVSQLKTKLFNLENRGASE